MVMVVVMVVVMMMVVVVVMMMVVVVMMMMVVVMVVVMVTAQISSVSKIGSIIDALPQGDLNTLVISSFTATSGLCWCFGGCWELLGAF